jgi:hypothetical protein
MLISSPLGFCCATALLAAPKQLLISDCECSKWRIQLRDFCLLPHYSWGPSLMRCCKASVFSCLLTFRETACWSHLQESVCFPFPRSLCPFINLNCSRSTVFRRRAGSLHIVQHWWRVCNYCCCHSVRNTTSAGRPLSTDRVATLNVFHSLCTFFGSFWVCLEVLRDFSSPEY